MTNPLRVWRNKWQRKSTATRTAIKLTILAEAMMLFFLAWGFVPYWYELVKIETPVYAQITEPVKIEPMPSEVKDTLDYFSDLYGVDRKLVYKIVECESNFGTDRIGDYQESLTSRGLWQFQPTTFFQYAKKYGVKNADLNDWRHQTLIAVQMLKDNLKNHWTCAK